LHRAAREAREIAEKAEREKVERQVERFVSFHISLKWSVNNLMVFQGGGD
jgi:hypothetical protein